MGKVILEFDSVEEQEDVRDALDGYKWKIAMWDFDQELRQTTKYGKSIIDNDKQASELEVNIAEKYRDMIREILSDKNLNLEP